VKNFTGNLTAITTINATLSIPLPLQAEENSGQETHSTSQGREAQRKTQS